MARVEPSGARRAPPPGWTLLAVLAAGALARAGYVGWAGRSRFDPWRHLALIRNLREGRGFTLFDDQPYLWYGPAWHGLAALWPECVRVEWLAALLSLGSVALLYALARDELRDRPAGAPGALAAAVLAALCGPVVAYTCHPGPEAFALLLALGALVGCRGRGAAATALCGVAGGLAVVLRTPFALLLLLALPRLAAPRLGRLRRMLAFGAGAALPLVATWLRNHAIVAAHPFVFTWDGLATPSDGFGLLSTLIPQLHPDVGEALRRLHARTMPHPEWLVRGDAPAWDLIALVGCGAIALALSRRPLWIAVAAGMLGALPWIDATGTSNFFRIQLPLLPVLFLGVGAVVAAGGRARWLGWLLVAGVLAGGAGLYRSPGMPALEATTPPPGLLDGGLDADAYMVNSGYFHPESLVYRFPDKRFIGLPLREDRWNDFRAAFPGYRAILWHGFSVQPELRRHLAASGWRVTRRARNAAGYPYALLRERGAEAKSPGAPLRETAAGNAGEKTRAASGGRLSPR